LIPHTTKEWLVEGFAIVGGGLGVSYSVWSVFEAWAAKRWPVTIGVVTATNMRVSPSRFGNYYDPFISYSYTVAGINYSGKRRRFGDTDYSFKVSAEARLARYDVGSPVEVHYHPVDPNRSVLELGLNLSTYFGLVVFGALFAAGLGLLLGILH
jgi:hypothetical protein